MRIHRLAAASLAAGVACTAGAQTPPIRAIVLSGDPVPDLPGHTFNSPFVPVINSSGNVAFSARTISAGGNTSGIWSDAPGPLTLVAREATPAPGGGVFASFNGTPLWLSDTGLVGFTAAAVAGDIGIWAQEAGPLVAVARVGGNVPGFVGSTYSSITGSPWVAFNNAGHSIFKASITSAPPAPSCVFSGAPGSLTLLARTSPNPPGGFTNFGIPLINDNDVGALLATEQFQTGTQGLYRGSLPAGLALQANYSTSPGTQAPDMAPGVTFSSILGPPGLANPNASIAFSAYVTGPGITSANTWGIWLKDAAGFHVLYREGQQVDDLPAGVQFRDPTTNLPRTPVISDSGHLAFSAPLQSPDSVWNNRQGIFMRRPDGTLRTVAYQTGPAPGFAPGSTFASFYAIANTCLNRRGQLVFVATVNVAGVGTREVVYGTDTRGAPSPLWTSGQTVFNPRPGLNITLGNFSDPTNAHPLLQGGTDSRRRCFSENGEFIFSIAYTRVPSSAGGGIGVFAVTIPSSCNAADIVGIGGSPPPDGLLTGDDFNAFIAAFANGDPLADIVGIGGLPPPDGLITGDDFNAFISAFASGCP